MFPHVWSEMCKFGSKCANRLCSFQHKKDVNNQQDSIDEEEINDSIEDENQFDCEVCGKE